MKATYTERQADGRWLTEEIRTMLEVSGKMARADREDRPWRLRTEDGVVFDNRNLLDIARRYSYTRMGK